MHYNMLFFKNQQKSKNTLKIQKKAKKKIFLFLNQFQILKFLTIKFLRCNIYQLSNDNINYVPKANLPKQNRSSWLFIQKNSKNTKKSKNPKPQKQQPYCYTTSIPSSNTFTNEQNCLIALFKTFFCQYLLFHILTMMYNIFFDINATEVKTNIPCK